MCACVGEAVDKKCGILEIKENQYRMIQVPSLSIYLSISLSLSLCVVCVCMCESSVK